MTAIPIRLCAPLRRFTVAIGVVACVTGCGSQARDFVLSDAPVHALTHARIIDGNGGPAADDQTIVVRNGSIAAVGPAAAVAAPPEAKVIDLAGRTVMPGLVGMHEHLFYGTVSGGQATFYAAHRPFAALYLASGVTTIRTAGSIDLDADLDAMRAVQAGRYPGPRVHVTSPYIEARGDRPDPERIAADVQAWADRGATSFKASLTLRPEELRAAIRAAHARRLRVTGHLCAVGFDQAAALGIDNLEHGLLVDSDFHDPAAGNQCSGSGGYAQALAAMDISDHRIRRTISTLVSHGVAVTSTLAIFETFTAREGAHDPRMLTVLAPRLHEQYAFLRAQHSGRANRASGIWSTLLRKEMEFERAFSAAGGLLLSGADPTGWGGLVAGFGDQRQVELLVEAGFTPEKAIQIATSNGAEFLREGQNIGTVAAGRRADLVVVRGDPSERISDVRNVELVFKDGVAYDPAALIESAGGRVGAFDVTRLLNPPVLFAGIGLAVLMIVRRQRRST